MSVDSLEQALAERFGYESFRPGQRETIEAVLAGRDTLTVLPTGAGKSLTFQLPALLGDGLTIVISPLIALMKDQVDRLVVRFPGAATYINSAVDPEDVRGRLAQASVGMVRLLYLAPERLRNRALRAALAGVRIDRIVVDEAHCVSEWGHDFRPDYLGIPRFAEAIGRPPILALTATATDPIRHDIVAQLGFRDPAIIMAGADRPNLRFLVQRVRGRDEKFDALLRALSDHPGSGIIYAGTRQDTETVAATLKAAGYRAEAYHAGLGGVQRNDIQDAFLDDRIRIVVATNAFGLGIDKPDVRFVIHYSAPSTPEAYYQEAGRAGRDGDPALCLLLYAASDTIMQERLVSRDVPTRDLLIALHDALRAMGSGQVRTDLETLARQLDSNETTIRVALSGLGRAGVLERGDDEGGWIVFDRVADRPSEAMFGQAAEEAERRIEHRRRLVRLVSTYASSTGCRRRWWLRYFGDPALPDPRPDCCDRCADGNQEEGDLPEPAWAAHRALRLVGWLRRPLGRRAIGGILKGSKAKDLLRYDAESIPGYGELAELPRATIDGVLDELVLRGFLTVSGDEYPTVSLSPRGKAVATAPAPPRIVWQPPQPDRPTKPERAKADGPFIMSGTYDATLARFRAGLSPEEIATDRGLVLWTVYGHLAALIGARQIRIEEVVDTEMIAEIRAAIERVKAHPPEEPVGFLRSIKDQCPETIDFAQIRCVVAVDGVLPSDLVKAEGGRRKAESDDGRTTTDDGRPTTDDRYNAAAQARWNPNRDRDGAAARVPAHDPNRDRDGAATSVPIHDPNRDRDAATDGWPSADAEELIERLGADFVAPVAASAQVDSRRLAVAALARTGDPRAIPDLRRALDAPDQRVRVYAITALGRIGDRSSLGRLSAIAHDDSTTDEVRRAARVAIARLNRKT